MNAGEARGQQRAADGRWSAGGGAAAWILIKINKDGGETWT